MDEEEDPFADAVDSSLAEPAAYEQYDARGSSRAASVFTPHANSLAALASTSVPVNGRFPCPACTKTFTLRANLTRHLREHTGERPFACPRCGKRYTRSDECTAHATSCAGAAATAAAPSAKKVSSSSSAASSRARAASSDRAGGRTEWDSIQEAAAALLAASQADGPSSDGDEVQEGDVHEEEAKRPKKRSRTASWRARAHLTETASHKRASPTTGSGDALLTEPIMNAAIASGCSAADVAAVTSMHRDMPLMGSTPSGGPCASIPHMLTLCTQAQVCALECNTLLDAAVHSDMAGHSSSSSSRAMMERCIQLQQHIIMSCNMMGSALRHARGEVGTMMSGEDVAKNCGSSGVSLASGNAHVHGANCGHAAIMLFDGTLHFVRENGALEGAMGQSSLPSTPPYNITACAPLQHDDGHVHGEACGHPRVQHGDHVDYLVGNCVHHVHDGHCDPHGSVTAISAAAAAQIPLAAV